MDAATAFALSAATVAVLGFLFTMYVNTRNLRRNEFEDLEREKIRLEVEVQEKERLIAQLRSDKAECQELYFRALVEKEQLRRQNGAPPKS